MIQLTSFSPATFSGSHSTLEPALDRMLTKTLTQNERIYLQVESAPGEAIVVTQFRVIVLKGANCDPAGKGYGRFFSLDEIARFEVRGVLAPSFIAVITTDTAKESIPLFNKSRCSFGVTLRDALGRPVATYLRELGAWIETERRTALLRNPLLPINVVGLALSPNEEFYLETSAIIYAEHAVRQYQGGYRGVSVPVVAGIRMNLGQTRGQSKTIHVTEADDQGRLLIGNQRVLFVGARRSSTLPLHAILTVTVFNNGLQIGVANKPVVQFGTDNEIPGLLLKRLLNMP